MSPVVPSPLPLIATMLLALLVACSPAAPPAATSSGSAPAPAKPPVEQKFVWGTSAMPATLHPYISIMGSQRRYDIFDTLIHLKDDSTLGPAVATSWKLVDPTTWEFTIRQDLKFHDGVPATIADIKFSVDRAVDPAKKYALGARLTTLKDSTAVNATTLGITTKDPDPLFLKRVMMISLLPKDYLEKVGDDGFQQKPIGTGPFRVVEWKESSIVRLVAMPEHPYRKATLTEAVIRQIPEASSRIAGLKTGELDYADGIPLDQGKGMEAAGFKLITLEGGASGGFSMDTVINDKPTDAPTRDKRVRQALNYAVDKDAIIKNIYQGYGQPEQCQNVQPETFGFNKNLKPYPYDPKKAKELLAAAGYPNGFKIVLRTQVTAAESQALALFVQSQFKDIGVDLDFQPIADVAVYRDMFYGVQSRPAIFGIGLTNRPAYDADYALTWFAGNQIPGQRHYDNPEFDKNFIPSQTEMNETKRLELLGKALEVFCEDPPYLFLHQLTQLQVAKADVTGPLKRPDVPDLSGIKRG